jgi:hypothetical protein
LIVNRREKSLKAACEAHTLGGGNLSSANLSGAALSWAALSRADLSGADLSEANLSWANLSGADLSEANLSGANLSGANLSGADLSSADLSWAALSGADLSGADLFGADLSGADLSSADLSWAALSGAKGVNKYITSPLYLLQDQPGEIHAYKLVTVGGEGPYNGGIKYEIGESYSVEDASTDENKKCAAGINLATLDWCIGEWRKGYRILIAEFKATDISAIPIGSDGKFRVHRCKIVGEKYLSELGLEEAEDEKL